MSGKFAKVPSTYSNGPLTTCRVGNLSFSAWYPRNTATSRIPK